MVHDWPALGGKIILCGVSAVVDDRVGVGRHCAKLFGKRAAKPKLGG
jgi:hypothetical protein